MIAVRLVMPILMEMEGKQEKHSNTEIEIPVLINWIVSYCIRGFGKHWMWITDRQSIDSLFIHREESIQKRLTIRRSTFAAVKRLRYVQWRRIGKILFPVPNRDSTSWRIGAEFLRQKEPYNIFSKWYGEMRSQIVEKCFVCQDSGAAEEVCRKRIMCSRKP